MNSTQSSHEFPRVFGERQFARGAVRFFFSLIVVPRGLRMKINFGAIEVRLLLRRVSKITYRRKQEKLTRTNQQMSVNGAQIDDHGEGEVEGALMAWNRVCYTKIGKALEDLLSQFKLITAYVRFSSIYAKLNLTHTRRRRTLYNRCRLHYTWNEIS